MLIIKNILVIAAIVLLAACGGNPSGHIGPAIDSTGTYIKFADATTFDPSWSKENVVVFHTTALPGSLHPTNDISAEREFIFRYTHMYLLNNDLMNRSMRPQLVKAMPTVSADELSFTYELIDNATWDDGSKVTVDDVIFTIKANRCPFTANPDSRVYLDDLKDVVRDASNPNKFTVVCVRKYMNNTAMLTDVPILQRTFYDKNNILAKYTIPQLNDAALAMQKPADLLAWANDFNDAKYGTDLAYIKGLGAYEVVNWEKGQTLTLKRKANHWTSKLTDVNPHETSFAERIIFKINTDENSAKLEFKSQKFDGTNLLSTRALRELQGDANFNKNYHSFLVPTYAWAYLVFNMKPDGVKRKKFFDDKNVRRAIAMLVPIDDVIRTVRAGNGMRIAANVSPLKIKEFDSTLKVLPLDITEAKKLLDAAGWKDTDNDGVRDKVIDGTKEQLSFEFMIPGGNPAAADMAKIMAEGIEKGGIKVNIVALDKALIDEKARKHDFDMFFGQWGGNSFQEDYTQLWSTKEWVSGGSNYPGFGTAETDALIDSIKYSVDENARFAYSKKLQRIIYNEQPYVFLYAPKRCVALHKRFGNTVMVNDNPNVMLNYLSLLRADEKGVVKSEPVN